MAALESLHHFLDFDQNKLSKEEKLILEAELYLRISDEIWKAYQTQYKDYFHLVKINLEKENVIMELHVIRCLINDILKSEAYTLSGIACYTQTPEEIVQDLLIGYKVSPVIAFTRKLIELHKIIRPDLYRAILKKITPIEEDDKE